ncbi:MAG: CPBP family intramembrane metalloprotease [Tannerella sp.]|jgi:membrane protease YdiL (CAAX protease family)|nr:CPBP family intramembrane metalloprotease [Tannerella sp.]
MKGIFANRSVLFQTGILFYLFLTGVIAGLVAGSLIVAMPGNPSADGGGSFYHIHAVQFCSCILSFLLPALVTAYLCSNHPKKFLHIHIINVRAYLLVFLMVIFLLPVIDLTAYLNSEIQLPEFMAPLENMMRETEDRLTQVTQSLLSERGVLPFVVNIIVIAVMAGITEEFMFRGVLLSLVRKKIKNPHVAIWLVAALFSAIHFQFYGFIPRLFLGAFLGYLLYWSKSIWAPVFAHMLHNAITIAASYTGLSTEFPSETAAGGVNMDSGEWLVNILIAATGLFLFVLCAKSMRKRCLHDESMPGGCVKASSCEAQNHGPDTSRGQSR